jgi:putative YhbY family RNA-binding protein
MEKLTSAQCRSLRAKAHALHPVVSIGQQGLSPAVLHEIDVALTAHELIKIRIFNDDRAERDAMLLRVCTEMAASPVQHLGKILIVFRPAPEAAPPPAASPKRMAKGKALLQRRRAPATTKGPFEPGRRPPRDRGAPATPGKVGIPRRRARAPSA